MNWKDISQAVGNAAPTLGTLLGGPAGAAVGSLISIALGTSNDPEAVNRAIAQDPQAAVKLQELQTNAQVELQRLAVQAELNRFTAEANQYAAEAADRASARELAAAQPTDRIRPAITIIMLLGTVAIVAAVFFGWNREIITDPVASLTVGTVMGFWFGELKQVLAFWFGMTKETQKLNATITDFAVAPGTVSKPDPLTKQASKNEG